VFIIYKFLFFLKKKKVFIILLVYHIYHSYGAHFFRGEHSTLGGSPGKKWGPDEKRINKLVFIGRNLDETAVKKGYKASMISKSFFFFFFSFGDYLC
jgi:hypothetical protein